MTRIALLSRFHFDQVKRGLEAYALHLQKAFPQIEIICFLNATAMCINPVSDVITSLDCLTTDAD